MRIVGGRLGEQDLGKALDDSQMIFESRGVLCRPGHDSAHSAGPAGRLREGSSVVQTTLKAIVILSGRSPSRTYDEPEAA